LAELLRRYPELDELSADEQPDFMFAKVFGEIGAPAMLADLLPLVESWRPDLLINDAAEFAAPIAARSLGMPHVTHAFGALLPEALVRQAGEATAVLWRAHGVEPRPYGGLYDHLYIDIYPPSLQPPGGEHVSARQLLRPVAFAGTTDDGVLTDITNRTGRPLVYLTFGTVFERYDLLAAAVAGIGELGVGLVVTVGSDGDPAALGPQPDHVVVERYIPQTQLLPACDVVASHAGSGTTLAALAMGIPQLCLPQRADQFLNAAAVAGAGAGVTIPPAAVDVTAVAQATRRLLEEPCFRDAARAVADEITLMPSPDDVATVLETLA
jgi:UDP:flavonoid glycosyltransferase YjiC (YdhE family)